MDCARNEHKHRLPLEALEIRALESRDRRAIHCSRFTFDLLGINLPCVVSKIVSNFDLSWSVEHQTPEAGADEPAETFHSLKKWLCHLRFSCL